MRPLDQSIPVERAALAEHYKEVESFQTARSKSVRRLSRIMIVVTSVALLGNFAQAWTIATMLPLAHIVPVFLWVRPDGTIDSAISVSRLPATQSQAVLNASLWEYVRMREGYSQDTARYAYEVVASYSAPQVLRQYQAYFNYPNPQSPQVTIGGRGTIEVEHISSYDVAPNVQQIRYRRVVTMRGGTPTFTTWTATLGYTTLENLPASLRLSNPGGVVVTTYQSSEDSVPTLSEPTPSTTLTAPTVPSVPQPSEPAAPPPTAPSVPISPGEQSPPNEVDPSSQSAPSSEPVSPGAPVPPSEAAP